MTFPEAQTPLFAGFKPVSRLEWEEKIKKDLKGKDPALLHTSTPEDISIRPFYMQEDVSPLPHLLALPGKFPFIRGHKTNTNHWQNLAPILVDNNSQAAIDQARRELAGGADGIYFKITATESFDLDYLVQHINLSQVPVCYAIPDSPQHFVDALMQKLKDHHQSPRALKGFILMHPAAGTGISCATGDQLEVLLEQAQQAVDFYGIAVNGAQFGNRGASAVQEIAFSLSMAVYYMEQLSARGFSLPVIFRNMQLTMSTGTHYFMEIAKLRALRWLWAGIVKASAEEAELAAFLRIHALTSSWTHTTFDPHSNILRASTEAMSAVIGGCDSLSIAPFDINYNAGNPFSAKIARNISLILKHEAYLDQVLDPAAGSYYLENLTQELAEKAWALFQQVETKGGFSAALSSGFIQQQISSVAQAKFQALASGKQVLVGTNKFTIQQEEFDYDAQALLQSRYIDTSRLCYPFEVMRLTALRHYQQKKARPKVVIAMLGHDIREHYHAAFAKEFFECGDFDTQLVSFDSIQQALEKLLFLDCRILVISGSQQDYAHFSRRFHETLKQHKHKPELILAAPPQDMKEELAEQGFDGYIFQNCDVTQIIARIQEKLVGE